MVAILVVAVVAALLVIHHFRCENSLASVRAWCDTGKDFTDWRIRNPGVYIGLSEEGRRLLARNLEAYEWFLRTHKYFDGNDHREWLISLFYEFPPKHPDDRGVPEAGVQTNALFFCLNLGLALF